MFSKKIYLYAIVCLAAFLSCQKLLIKPDPTSVPEKNFEIFWNDLNNGYPYFVEDNIDWQARHDNFRKLVTSSTSIDQLYTYMTQMLTGFSDGHLSVQYNGASYSNEKTIPEIIQLVRQDQSGARVTYSDPLIYYYDNYNQISQSYLDNPIIVSAPNSITPSLTDTIATYGNIASENILYVNIATFNTDFSIENMLQSIFSDNPTTEGLILDLRMNGGGNLGIMWDAISVFLPQSANAVTYAYNKEKVGPLPGNFGIEKYFQIAQKDNQKFLKPIVVLTNRLTVSAAEHATMAMRQIKKYNPKIKIIGDYTFGATSFIVERTLPCGIKYTLVNSKTWDINHVIIEKIGVKPDEQVFLTADKIQQNDDEQMNRAIDVIKGNLF